MGGDGPRSWGENVGCRSRGQCEFEVFATGRASRPSRGLSSGLQVDSSVRPIEDRPPFAGISLPLLYLRVRNCKHVTFYPRSKAWSPRSWGESRPLLGRLGLALTLKLTARRHSQAAVTQLSGICRHIHHQELNVHLWLNLSATKLSHRQTGLQQCYQPVI